MAKGDFDEAIDALDWAELEEYQATLLIDGADISDEEKETYFEVLEATDSQVSAFASESTIDFGQRICGFVPNETQIALGLNWYTDQQLRISQSVRDNPNTIIFSGNGIGKTLWLALEVLAHFYNGFAVVTTAPVKRQVENLWSEIRTLRNMAGDRGISLPGRWAPRAQNVEIDPKWTLSGYTARVGSNEAVATAFAGKHYKKMFGVMDELVGVREPVWEAIFRILTGAHDRFLGAGNPTEPTAYAARAAKMRDAAGKPVFNVLHLSSEDHPNVIHGLDVIPGATSRKFCAMQLAKGGSRDSAYYRTSVLGLFPNQGEDALIRSEWVEAALLRGEARNEDSLLPVGKRKLPKDHRGVALGLDVAGEGKDLTVLMGCENGKLFYPKLFKANGDTLPCWHRGRDHSHATELLVQALKQIPRVLSVSIDDTGLGAAVSAELWNRRAEFPEIPIYIVKGRRASPHEFMMQTVISRLNFGGAPPGGADDVMGNMKSALWFNFRELLRLNKRDLPTEVEQRAAGFPEESDLKAQILAPIMHKDDRGKMWILDKRASLGARGKELSKHLPDLSPDIAHAAILASEAWEILPERYAAPATPIEVAQVEKEATIAAAINQQSPGSSQDARRPWQRRAR